MRLANFGYLRHMWELNSMWTWLPTSLIISYARASWTQQSARMAGFGAIAIGAVGSVLAGKLVDRLGRTRVARRLHQLPEARQMASENR